MYVLSFYHTEFKTECLLWLALFLPLAVKTPLVPFHIWLPEAHVEAPTIGSVILAALILKMSGFGFIRVLLPLCPRASVYFSSSVFCICILGGIYVAFTACSQTDLKKIIAASSIVHMSYATLGVFNFDSLSLISAIIAMFAHGIISAGLFFSIGYIYHLYGERDLAYYSNLKLKLPYFTFAFFFLIFSNTAFPGTINFPAELGIFLAIFHNNPLLSFFLLIPLILNGAYNIWALTRFCFGPDKPSVVIKHVEELDMCVYILYFLVAFSLLLGLFPNFLISGIEDFVKSL